MKKFIVQETLIKDSFRVINLMGKENTYGKIIIIMLENLVMDLNMGKGNGGKIKTLFIIIKELLLMIKKMVMVIITGNLEIITMGIFLMI